MPSPLVMRRVLAGGNIPLGSLSWLTFWVDARDPSTLFQDSAFTTPAVANNDPVGGWKDKGPLGLHLTQATSGNRPSLKTNLRAGQPGVRTDGVTASMGGAIVSLTSFTAFLVLSGESFGNGFRGPFLWRNAGNAGFQLAGGTNTSGLWRPHLVINNAAGTETQNLDFPETYATSVVAQLYTLTSDPGGYTNLTSERLAAGVTGFATTLGLTIGRAFQTNLLQACTFFEIGIVSPALPPSMIPRVQNGLISKWTL